MTKQTLSLTKTCSICGQQKPLSAFLLMTGPQTSEYGSVCATCRKAGLDKPKTSKDDSTRSSTGGTIDTKARIHTEMEKRQQQHQVEEEYHKERDEKEIETTKTDEKKDKTLFDEKKHRQVLERRSFLSTEAHKRHQQKSPSTAARIQAQTAAGEEQIKQQIQATKEESQLKEIDLTAPVEDTRIEGKIKFSGDTFKRFSSWLGKNSPISQSVELSKEKKEAPEKPSNYIDKTWGPSSRK